jgi:sulfur relay (sulfurtransferase) DsrF/TusC family protein
MNENANAVKVYPNPSATGVYNLEINNYVYCFNKYSVYTIDGRLITEESLPDIGFVERKINLENNASGIYLLVLQQSNGTKTIRLIK